MVEHHQFCTFFVNDIYLGVAVQHVQEILRYQEITPVPLAPAYVCGLVNLRGQIVTTIDLRCRLQLGQIPAHSLDDSSLEQLPLNVVVRTDSELVSLLVDKIGDIIEVAQDSFEQPPKTLKGELQQLLQGAYKLKDGFLLVLDTEKILSESQLP